MRLSDLDPTNKKGALRGEIRTYDPTTKAGRQKIGRAAIGIGLAPVTGGLSLGIIGSDPFAAPKVPDPGAPPTEFDLDPSDAKIRDIVRMQRLASRGRLGLKSTFLTGPRGVGGVG